MTLQQKQKDYNWYYTSATFEADGTHTHDDNCPDSTYTVTETGTDGVSVTSKQVTKYGGCRKSGLEWMKFVTFADTPTQAIEIATAYAAKQIPEGFRFYTGGRKSGAIDLYLKNYIRDSRALVASGAYCGVKPAGV